MEYRLKENLAHPADAELVRLALANDRAAFALLYRRYCDRVRGTIYRIAGHTQLDDLTQDCFVRIWKGLANLEEPSFLGTWIYKVAVNTALDAVRKKKPQFSVPLEIVDKSATSHEIKLTVAELLSALPPDARTILVLCDMEGCTRVEAAKILSIPEGTVKSRLANARKLAREFLSRKDIAT